MRRNDVVGGRSAWAASLGVLAAALAAGLLSPLAFAGFHPEILNQLDAAIIRAVGEKQCPGAVLWLEHGGQIHQRAFGQRAIRPAAEAMTLDTIFDVASLTKPLATAPAVMRLIERGEVELDAPAHRYLPEFRGGGAEAITVRHLLTHTSGLFVGISGADFQDAKGAMAVALRERPHAPPGQTFHYCDVNFILLGELVERVTGQRFEAFVAREIHQPLGMGQTCFRPPVEWRPRIAPTVEGPEGWLRGTAQDPTARRMGGVAGHAGLFSTAADLARFARMLLGQGEGDGKRVFQAATIQAMTRVQTPDRVLPRRGLGWDIDTGYSRPRGLVFPLGSYGHSAFTGGFLWVDPFSKTFVILLTNRLHPDGRGQVAELYGIVGTLAARAIDDFDFEHVRGALAVRTNFISWGAVTNALARRASDR